MRANSRLFGAVCVLAAFVAVAPAAASAASNLIADGSFEQPAVASGSFILFTTGQSFNGWKVVGASGNIGIVSGSYVDRGIKFVAENGSQWLDLTGFSSNKATGVSRTVSTVVGRSYRLTFWVGNVDNPAAGYGSTSTVNVSVNGTHKLTATNAIGSTTKQAWKMFSLAITATSARTTIAFINGDPANDNTNGLDGVQLS
jgi:hypothetical protein